MSQEQQKQGGQGMSLTYRLYLPIYLTGPSEVLVYPLHGVASTSHSTVFLSNPPTLSPCVFYLFILGS